MASSSIPPTGDEGLIIMIVGHLPTGFLQGNLEVSRLNAGFQVAFHRIDLDHGIAIGF